MNEFLVYLHDGRKELVKRSDFIGPAAGEWYGFTYRVGSAGSLEIGFVESSGGWDQWLPVRAFAPYEWVSVAETSERHRLT